MVKRKLLTFFLLALVFPRIISAATLTVTSNTDAGGTCPDATSCTLRQAIIAAASGDTINFSASITTLTLTSAELLIDKSLTINGPGADQLTVQRSTAGGTPQFRIFNIASGNFTVTISRLTISNGNAPAFSGGGGGIFNVSTGTVNVTNCTITGNSSQIGGDGGGIHNGADSAGSVIANFGAVNITNSIISNNSATNSGGGIFNSMSSGTGTVNIANSTISGNSALDGGGIFNGDNSNGAITVNVTNSTISGNSAGGNGGGGIFNGDVPVTLNISNSTISGNSGRNYGGGILVSFANTVTITNSTISGNSASFGGGIAVSNSRGTVNLTNSTVSGNSATNGGGGIFNDVNPPGTVNAKSSLIAGNSDSTNQPDFRGRLTSGGYNLIGNNSGATITQATGDQIGTSASPIDSKLDPAGLKNNGGPAQTIALLFGSPAIDKGTSNGLTGNLTTDQRGSGFARTFDDPNLPNAAGGDGTDIGAFEVQTVLPPPTTLANISTRLPVQTGDNVLIGGFIVTGTQPKKVIVRGIGPSLSVPGKLADPLLELHDGSGQLLESNDNWMDSPNKQAIIDSTIPPTNNLESAIVRTLPANNAGYTAILRGANNGTGIGVVEAYDLDRTVDSKLANISTRGLVQTGDNVLIAGTIILGQAPQKVIIRAIGPSLSVPGKLADPTLELRDSNGALLEANDNWVDSPNKQAIIDSTIPPTNDLESAIVRTLPANGASYTAIVRGVNNTTGIAVVEVYALN